MLPQEKTQVLRSTLLPNSNVTINILISCAYYKLNRSWLMELLKLHVIACGATVNQHLSKVGAVLMSAVVI